ncbi:MAG: ABC transporter ATP-binding protein [Betaproteobacteria bacterium]|nr:ABC transporter ATP-binding protein [Betaproteobacteria bacterium]
MGGAALGGGARGLLCLPEPPRVRHPAPDHRAVCALARSRARLRRHRHARPRGVLRRRRLHRGHARAAPGLERAALEPRGRRAGRGRDRAGERLGLAAHARPDAAHADAVHHGAARGGREHGRALHGRIRRHAGPRVPAAAGHLPVRRAVLPLAVPVCARGALRVLRGGAGAGVFALRAEPHRNPREPAAHARGGRAGARAPGARLCDLGCARGRRRRALHSGERLRQPCGARARSRRGRAHHPDPGRLRAPLRGLRGCARLPAARARARQGLSHRLAARPGAGADGGGAVRAQRHSRHRRVAAPAARRAEGGVRAPLLETRGLCKSFGALEVARDIDFRLERGARHALIGPNGAGKTTLVNLLTGALQPSRGSVLLEGDDLAGLAQAKRVKRGLARTFQINQLFRGLTVLENVCIAVAERLGVGGSMLRPAGKRADVIGEASRLLEMLRLQGDAGRRVAELPYGRQRLVELAIALGLKPRVLLLDEPAAGIPSAESHILLDAIAALPADIAVLIIEHDMDLVFRFARRITVMVSGAVFAEGSPAEIAANREVRAVYLGSALDA